MTTESRRKSSAVWGPFSVWTKMANILQLFLGEPLSHSQEQS